LGLEQELCCRLREALKLGLEQELCCRLREVLNQRQEGSCHRLREVSNQRQERESYRLREALNLHQGQEVYHQQEVLPLRQAKETTCHPSSSCHLWEPLQESQMLLHCRHPEDSANSKGIADREFPLPCQTSYQGLLAHHRMLAH
jgi:hypothetical protein